MNQDRTSRVRDSKDEIQQKSHDEEIDKQDVSFSSNKIKIFVHNSFASTEPITSTRFSWEMKMKNISFIEGRVTKVGDVKICSKEIQEDKDVRVTKEEFQPFDKKIDRIMSMVSELKTAKENFVQVEKF
ncbi:hypothetical protein L1887_28753 [Cichorium endivia]|nr:hypothetical protein L1887_28753 [Cichorium endivia]